MPEPKDYKHIRAWGMFMQSFEYYIKQEQERAALDAAPLDAIYKRQDKWRRFSDVENEQTRHEIEQIMKKEIMKNEEKKVRTKK